MGAIEEEGLIVRFAYNGATCTEGYSVDGAGPFGYKYVSGGQKSAPRRRMPGHSGPCAGGGCHQTTHDANGKVKDGEEEAVPLVRGGKYGSSVHGRYFPRKG